MILSAVLSETKKDYALLLRLAGAVCVCLVTLRSVSGKLTAFISSAQSLTEQGELVTVLLKGAAICMITGFVCELCRESGNCALSHAAEAAARVMMTVLALPLINSVIETAFSFLKQS